MKSLRLKTKLSLALLLTWLGLFLIGGLAAMHARNVVMAEREAAVKHVVDLGYTMVDTYVADVAAQRMDEASARKQALERLSKLRFDGKNFLFVIDSKPTMLMHPFGQNLVGTDVGERKDPNGKAYYKEMAMVGQKDGQGFVAYQAGVTAPDGTTKRLDKVSYVRHVAAWDWNIMSGVLVDDIDTAFHATLIRMFVFVLLIGGAIHLSMRLIIRSVINSLGGEPSQAVAAAERIAEGDLSTAVDLSEADRSKGHSLMHAMSGMQTRLATLISNIRVGTEEMSHAAGEIAAGNMNLSSRTESQASSLQQTAASMEQLTGTVAQNAENAVRAGKLADTASGVAEAGGEVMGNVVQTMRGISSSSARIAEIIGVIDGIAFQTNILALNAAVEAARAGEQGRGFAVVASEVRTLAQRSAQAAKEIKSLIDASVAQVQDGSALVNRAGQTMGEIVTAVGQVRVIIAEISAASQEQRAGIVQVSQAMTQIDQFTQENAALVEESAAVAHALNDQAHSLAQQVSVFRVANAS